MTPVVIIAVLLALAWVFLGRPVKRRQRQHQAMQDDVGVGDEIITAGGIHAVVRAVDENELQIEIAPQVVVTLDRRAVAAVAEAPPASEGDQARLATPVNDPGES
jgi:preprotein translocase subunit YajC